MRENKYYIALNGYKRGIVVNALNEMRNTLLQQDRSDELISWADLYDTASFESRKMIVNCLIKRVEVFQDYRLNVEFNFDLNQFAYGLNT